MSFGDLERRHPQRASLDKIVALSDADKRSGGRVEDVLGALRRSAQGARRIEREAAADADQGAISIEEMRRRMAKAVLNRDFY